jgi:hypothetical protein
MKRICTKCRVNKELSEFHNNKSGKFGKQCVCKDCQRELVRKNYKKEYFREYARNNRERYVNYTRQKMKSDVDFKLRHSLRDRLNKALRGNFKSGSAVRDLGCTIEELKVHLESQFQPGMSWENWSLDGWHIDHIKPLSSFNLSDRQQLLEACHYTNLQPLWASDNLSKNKK